MHEPDRPRVLLFSPHPSPLARALRDRGIRAEQCFSALEIVDQLARGEVCAVALCPEVEPDTNRYLARILTARHPEVTVMAIGPEVTGVSLHLSWPLPRDAVFLQWLEIEGAPLRDDDESVTTNLRRRPAYLRGFDPSTLVDEVGEPTLDEEDLDTILDELRSTERLASSALF